MKKAIFFVVILAVFNSTCTSAPAPIKKPVQQKPVKEQCHCLVGKWRMLWRENYYTARFYANGRYEDDGCKEGWWYYNETNGRLMVDEYWDGVLARSWAVCFSVPFEGFEDCGLVFKMWKIESE